MQNSVFRIANWAGNRALCQIDSNSPSICTLNTGHYLRTNRPRCVHRVKVRKPERKSALTICLRLETDQAKRLLTKLSMIIINKRSNQETNGRRPSSASIWSKTAGCAAHLPVVYTSRFADRISTVVNRRPASSSSSRLQRGLSSGRLRHGSRRTQHWYHQPSGPGSCHNGKALLLL